MTVGDGEHVMSEQTGQQAKFVDSYEALHIHTSDHPGPCVTSLE